MSLKSKLNRILDWKLEFDASEKKLRDAWIQMAIDDWIKVRDVLYATVVVASAAVTLIIRCLYIIGTRGNDGVNVWTYIHVCYPAFLILLVLLI